MATITIRSVSDETRNELAARAARSGRSLQEFLRLELERLASRPAKAELMERVRERVERTGTRLSAKEIVALRDTDRR